jgi:hypothetical protein
VAEPAIARSVRPIHPVPDVVPLTRFDLHDIESVRLLLRGSSIVDWVSLHFAVDEDIDAFLRVNGFEPSEPKDQMRLLVLKRRAAVYLEEHLNTGSRRPSARRLTCSGSFAPPATGRVAVPTASTPASP